MSLISHLAGEREDSRRNYDAGAHRNCAAQRQAVFPVLARSIGRPIRYIALSHNEPVTAS